MSDLCGFGMDLRVKRRRWQAVSFEIQGSPPQPERELAFRFLIWTIRLYPYIYIGAHTRIKRPPSRWKEADSRRSLNIPTLRGHTRLTSLIFAYETSTASKVTTTSLTSERIQTHRARIERCEYLAWNYGCTSGDPSIYNRVHILAIFIGVGISRRVYTRISGTAGIKWCVTACSSHSRSVPL